MEKGKSHPKACKLSRGRSGVTRRPSNNTEAECFKMFMTPSTMNMIMTETNSHPWSLRGKFNNAGKLAKWVDTTVAELYVFLAVFFPQ